MKRRIILGIAILAFFSFTLFEIPLSGEYGDVEQNGTIGLLLKKDGSFLYTDYSNPENLVEVRGKFETNERVIILSGNEEHPNFHQKWKVNKEGNAIKSRKGATFYRLALNADPC